MQRFFRWVASRTLGVLAGPFLTWFGRRYDYDTSYMRWMLEEAPLAFLAFGAGMFPLSGYRGGAPLEAWFAAKLVGAVSEDCGPCTQLVTNMAREAGVAPDQLRAVLERNVDRMQPATRLGFRFADALVRRDPAEDAIREEVRTTWGAPAVVGLTLAISVGRVFPMTKAGLGFARECRLVQVAGEPVLVAHAT